MFGMSNFGAKCGLRHQVRLKFFIVLQVILSNVSKFPFYFFLKIYPEVLPCPTSLTWSNLLANYHFCYITLYFTGGDEAFVTKDSSTESRTVWTRNRWKSESEVYFRDESLVPWSDPIRLRSDYLV